MNPRVIRALAVTLFATTLLFVPLVVLGERLALPSTVVGLYLYAAWIFAPVVAFAGLVILVEVAYRRNPVDDQTRWQTKVLMWTLGPLGCLLAVWRLTRPQHDAAASRLQPGGGAP